MGSWGVTMRQSDYGLDLLSDLYTNYLNIDIFPYPLGIRSISQLALFPLCLLLTTVCVYVHCHKKPAAGRDLLGRVAYRINSVTDKFLRRLHLFGMELHKTLWIQKGVVIAALLVYVAFGLTYYGEDTHYFFGRTGGKTIYS